MKMSKANTTLIDDRSVALIVSTHLKEKKIAFILVLTGLASLLALYFYYKFCTHMNKKKFEENYQSAIDEINRYATRKKLYIKKKQEQLKAKKDRLRDNEGTGGGDVAAGTVAATAATTTNDSKTNNKKTKSNSFI